MKTIGYIVGAIEMVLRKEKRGMLKKTQIQEAVRVGINNFFDKQLIAYRQTGIIPAPLEPFIKKSTETVTDGSFNVPSDFSKAVTFTVANVNSNPAEFMDISEFEDRKNSVLMPPTEVDPIGTTINNQIHVRPLSIKSVSFTYIKKPIDVVIGTTLSGDGRERTYDDNSSTDTEFYKEYYPDITKEALQFLSVPQQDEGAAALSSTVKQ